MKKYLEKVLQLVKKFKETNFVQIPREENMEADTVGVYALKSNLLALCGPILPCVPTM